MDREQNNFVDLDLHPDEFKKLGYRVVDMIAAYYSSIRNIPVSPNCKYLDVESAFREDLPQQGQEPAHILNEWSSKVLPYSTHMGSPRFFGYVMGSGTMMGTLAEALAASINSNAGGWKPAPVATEIERRTIVWLAQLLGYPSDCGGLFTSGGTMANFTAITTALRNTGYNIRANGVQEKKFTLYVSAHEGHISIFRVAELMNLGADSVRLVKNHADFTMDIADLEQKIDEDRARGYLPFCVVAQVGSINVGAIDPLEDIAEICHKKNLWFHADGACGAMGAMLPEKKSQYQGLELADSVTLDPHKWLYIPYECGGVLVREPEKLKNAFTINASYLKEAFLDENKMEGIDYFNHGPQMSRSFRALKVWMSIKHYGVAGYRQLLSQNVQCIEYLDGLVRKDENFRALHKPNLFMYCFQFAPQKMLSGWSGSIGEQDMCLDKLNQQMADNIRQSGVAFIMTSKIRERVVIRMSICSHRTTLEDIDKVFSKLQHIGKHLMV